MSSEEVAETVGETPAESSLPEGSESTNHPAESSSPEPTVETLPESSDDRMSFIMDGLGEMPDEPNSKLIESLTAKDIASLPDSVKGILKHSLALSRQEFSKKSEVFTQREQELASREAELKKANDEMIRNRAKLNEMFLDERFQKHLDKAEIPDEELADINTPEGLQQRIEREAAKANKAIHEPIIQAARQAKMQSDYQEFCSTHPKMNDDSFKGEMLGLMKERKEAGKAIGWDDAYALTEAKRYQAAQEAKAAKERRERAISNAQIQQRTTSSKSSSNEIIPNWVSDGYDGYKGDEAVNRWLRDNPDAVKKFLKARRNA